MACRNPTAAFASPLAIDQLPRLSDEEREALEHGYVAMAGVPGRDLPDPAAIGSEEPGPESGQPAESVDGGLLALRDELTRVKAERDGFRLQAATNHRTILAMRCTRRQYKSHRSMAAGAPPAPSTAGAAALCAIVAEIDDLILVELSNVQKSLEEIADAPVKQSASLDLLASALRSVIRRGYTLCGEARELLP